MADAMNSWDTTFRFIALGIPLAIDSDQLKRSSHNDSQVAYSFVVRSQIKSKIKGKIFQIFHIESKNV